MKPNLITLQKVIGVIVAVALPLAFFMFRVHVRPPLRIIGDIEALTGGLAKEVSTWEVPPTAVVGSAMTFALSLTGRLLPQAQSGASASGKYSVNARLMGDSGIAIQSLSKESQPLGGRGPEWEWLVEPRDPGQRELRLSIDVCSDAGTCRTHVTARTITVERSLVQVLVQILGYLANPLSAFLFMGFGWVLKAVYDEWRAERKREAEERRKLREKLLR